MRRPSLRLLAAGAVLAVVAACGGGGSGGGEGARGREAEVDPELCPVDALETADGPVEIEFWHGMTASNEETLQALTDEYNASQDQVRVSLVFKGSYDETLDAYLTALRGGDLPHVIQLEETTLQLMIDSGSMVPVESCIEAADFDTADYLPRVLDQFRVEDVLWPMPFNVSNPLLYYNRVAFEEAGLDPDAPPSTLGELEEAARTLVDQGITTQAISLEVQASFLEQWQSIAGEELADHENGRAERATEVNIDTEVMSELYGFYSRMVEDGLALNVGRNPTGADHFFAIADRDAAMTVGSSAALGSIYDALGSGDVQARGVELGIAPFPAPETGDSGATAAGGAALWMVANDSNDAQRAATFDYMTYLTAPEQQVRWHLATGYIPIRQSAVDDPEVAQLWEERPGFRVAFDQLAAAGEPPGGGGPVIGSYVEFRDAIENALELILSEGADPAEALAQSQEEAQAALDDYNERSGD